MSVLTDLRDSRDLLVNLTLRDIRGKYKRTALGQIWSLLNPIAQMLTYSVVFAFVLRSHPAAGDPSGLDIFALWLTAGLLPWLFFVNVVTTGMTSLVDNANLIQKVYFPRETLVIANMLGWFFTHAIEMSVLVVAILIFGGSPLPWLPLTIVFMVVMAMFALGISLILSVANVYFRDTQHFISIAIQVFFYATPIVYPLTLVTAKAKQHPAIVRIYQLNPIERFTKVFRATLYDGRAPGLWDSIYVTAFAVGSLVVGYWVFKRYEGRLAEEL